MTPPTALLPPTPMTPLGKARVVQADLCLSLALDSRILSGRRIAVQAEIRHEQPDWLTWEKISEVKIASARFQDTVPAGKVLLLRMPLAYTQRQRLTSFRVDGQGKLKPVRSGVTRDVKAIVEGYIYAFLRPEIVKP